MAAALLSLLFFFPIAVAVVDAGAAHSPYRSPTTFLADYNRMLSDLKIYVYDQSKHPPASPLELLFHTHLLRSPFLTSDPELAHLFYLSFPGRASARSIARSIRRLRHDLPYWNRSLGADHFYLLCGGLGPHSDRNLVELRKNAVQVSCFPPAAGKFIPHKDVTLPPPLRPGLPPAHSDAARRRQRYLGYYLGDAAENATSFLDELRKDPSFLVESAGSGSRPVELAEKLLSSKFCIFFSGAGGFSVGEALRYGCVPAVIADGPVAGLPFADVLRWGEVAVFGRAAVVKRALEEVAGAGERYNGLRESGMRASVHFDWDVSADRYDVFRTVMYQLWMRRHVIRYTPWKLENVDED